ncbi:MAG TPA: RdgB/HAM1 family non-canonical purine NTP pyrophosphatase [Edaphocola sp.]|nr:RdgB/HAM1 family non-canonical purine NTP pyrophosphatase [Edaphocola sp.]
MELIFATNNQRKLREVRQIVGAGFTVRTLKDVAVTEELPEPFDTFERNAWSKAHYVFQKLGKNCFAEDSGLVVPALNGAPGVFSARYAGEPSDDEKNNQELIGQLKDKTDLTAWYQATICLIVEGQAHYFEGKCEGRIALTPRGNGGFGYDPLFMPKGYSQTFGELSAEVKNKLSHRSKAVRQLADFLNAL